jgi:hypothetical protein
LEDNVLHMNQSSSRLARNFALVLCNYSPTAQLRWFEDVD